MLYGDDKLQPYLSRSYEDALHFKPRTPNPSQLIEWNVEQDDSQKEEVAFYE